jgi:hypothetical protein
MTRLFTFARRSGEAIGSTFARYKPIRLLIRREDISVMSNEGYALESRLACNFIAEQIIDYLHVSYDIYIIPMPQHREHQLTTRHAGPIKEHSIQCTVQHLLRISQPGIDFLFVQPVEEQTSPLSYGKADTPFVKTMKPWSPVTTVTQLEACRRLLTSAYSYDAQGLCTVKEIADQKMNCISPTQAPIWTSVVMSAKKRRNASDAIHLSQHERYADSFTKASSLLYPQRQLQW